MLPGARQRRAGEGVALLSRRRGEVRPLTSRKARRAAAADLTGRKILVVEDSPVVGPFTADLLDDLGCEVVGPAPNMAAARELAQSEQIDAALMDIHIRGERVFSVCDILDERGVPFVLTSGYADWQMPDDFKDRPRLNKPYTLDDVRKALAELLDSAGQ